jgi:hypothetical protein
MFLLTGPVLYGALSSLLSSAPACARHTRQPPEAKRWPLQPLLTQRPLRPRRQRAAARAGPLPRRTPLGRTRGRHLALVRTASPSWAPSFASCCREAHAAFAPQAPGRLGVHRALRRPQGCAPPAPRASPAACPAVASHSHSPDALRAAPLRGGPQRTSSSPPPDRSRTARRRRCGASCTPSRVLRRATTG